MSLRKDEREIFLIEWKGFETANHPVQPPVPSLAPFRTISPNDSTTPSSVPATMSSSSGGGVGGGSKRSSPLNYFSLDIPASLLGSSSASPSSSNSSLPHQSCSLPFVARLVRTPSTSSSSGHGTSDSQDQHHFQQVIRNVI